MEEEKITKLTRNDRRLSGACSRLMTLRGGEVRVFAWTDEHIVSGGISTLDHVTVQIRKGSGFRSEV